jgi:TPR repeat protein
MFAMGRLYQLGLGVSQDYDTALKWYRKAAAEGSADAMAAIGAMFQNGFSVTRDRDSAAQWYGKAEAAGSPDAGEMLRQHGVD